MIAIGKVHKLKYSTLGKNAFIHVFCIVISKTTMMHGGDRVTWGYLGTPFLKNYSNNNEFLTPPKKYLGEEYPMPSPKIYPFTCITSNSTYGENLF
jgi:hypothetical protein